MARTLEQQTMAKVSWRLLPLIVVIYFVAYVDRSNLAFAASSLNKALGFTPYIYGWGAGMFFLGYFLFEVPSNVILHRVGARVWIARIMVTWGIVSALMVFITGVKSFFAVRFLLGVAEAGFFPGVLLYFTYWFPPAYRGRVIAALFLAVPGSNALSSAISGPLLNLNGVWGLAGWQWMFLIESMPAILLAPVVLKVLTDRPALATWLDADQRAWLATELSAERRAIEATRALTLVEALKDRRVLGLSLVYLTITAPSYGIAFFVPLIIRSHGLSDVRTGLITAIPYTVGVVGMVLFAFSSDRSHERRWHFVIASLLAAAGLIVAGFTHSLTVALAGLSVAAIGIYGSKPPFWPLPSQFLSGTAAAGGIALVNAIGNLGGFIGPYAVGWISNRTHRYEDGLFFLAVCAAVSALLAVFVVPAMTPAMPRRSSRALKQ